MTSSSPAPADGPAAIPEAPLPPMFYVVSKRKLAILFLATFTLYTLYWFYKHWDLYKGRHPEASRFGTTIWPVPRAAFPMFFTHSLFAKVQAYGRQLPQVAHWHSGWHASVTVAWMLLSEVADRLVGGAGGDLVSIACIFPMLFLLLKAQDMVNLACGDARGAGNDVLTRANKAWLVIGAVFWLVALAGFFVPDEDDDDEDNDPQATAAVLMLECAFAPGTPSWQAGQLPIHTINPRCTS